MQNVDAIGHMPIYSYIANYQLSETQRLSAVPRRLALIHGTVQRSFRVRVLLLQV